LTALSRKLGQLAVPAAAIGVASAAVVLLDSGGWPVTLPALALLALATGRIASLAGAAELDRLRRENAGLEQLVHEVSRLREAERAKADFVATVCHELRTPITPIKGYVELLRTRGESMPEDLRQDILRTMAERTDHMARLIEDLLLASRISSEGPGAVVLALQLELTDLVEVTRQAAADYLREPTCRLTLELPAQPLEVRADPLRLSQILVNLLSNAHKYSPPDAPIRLRLWSDGGWARAAVVDQGQGIPDEELERIFDKFHRVDDPMTMTTGGTGVGLYIARELARAMGGEVQASSTPRGGSTFTVRLPLARQAGRATIGPVPVRGASGAAAE
jgi:signal transduction histidine kinase